MLDFFIKNAQIVDGTGAQPYFGSIGIQGDTIVFADAEKHSGETARRVLDADRQMAVPGFIDIHCHSDAVIFHPGKNRNRLLQGFTTEVIGNCGLSLAPTSPETLDALRQYCGPFFSYMPVPYNWRSFSEYLTALERQQPLLNTAALVGHGTLRIALAGLENRPLTDGEQETMNGLLRECLEAGAFGFSTGLFYAPGVFAGRQEILQLAKITAEYGGLYATHLRSESRHLAESVAETLSLAEQSGVHVEFSHHKASGRENFGKVRQTLAMIEDANARGLEVHCDVYPYVTANTQFSSILPPWALAGGTDALLSRLRTPELRAQVIRDLKGEGAVFENLYLASGWDKILINECSAPEFVGKTIAQIAEERGADPFEAAMDVIVEGNNSAMMMIELMCEEDVAAVLKGRYSMVCTDGFPSQGKCHPRYTASFIRVLEKYVRQERLLTLPEAIQKMTGLPAQKLGLPDRGRIAPGCKADLLLLNPERIHDTADYDHPDGLAQGLDIVMINGVLAMEQGKSTGVCAGRVLHRNRAEK